MRSVIWLEVSHCCIHCIHLFIKNNINKHVFNVVHYVMFENSFYYQRCKLQYFVFWCTIKGTLLKTFLTELHCCDLFKCPLSFESCEWLDVKSKSSVTLPRYGWGEACHTQKTLVSFLKRLRQLLGLFFQSSLVQRNCVIIGSTIYNII